VPKRISDSRNIETRLIQILEEDPSITSRAMAEKLGGNQATLRLMLKRLVDDRVVRVMATSDAPAMGYDIVSILFIKTKNRSSLQVGKDLAEIPEITAIDIIFGEYDLICLALSKERDDLRALITRKVSGVSGVSNIRCSHSLSILHLSANWGQLSNDRDLERIAAHTRSLITGLDDVGNEILRIIQLDGRVSKRSIAKEIGLAEGTVRYRLLEMEKQGLVKRRLIIDPTKSAATQFPVNCFAYVCITVDPARIEQIGAMVAKVENVTFVAVVAGNFDIIASVVASNRIELLSIIEQKVLSIAGIEKTHTFETVQSCKHNNLVNFPETLTTSV
jgi:DNA-binding Lrp family transcriptional regulator